MIEELKPFSQELYRENDLIAKQTAVDYLLYTGQYCLNVNIEDQPEAFKSRDFQIFNTTKNMIVNVEAERKKVWTVYGLWQGWPTIDIPYRKRNSQANIFIMTNRDCNSIACGIVSQIKESPVSAKKTKYTENELFFNVPLNLFRFYKKIENSWQRFYI